MLPCLFRVFLPICVRHIYLRPGAHCTAGGTSLYTLLPFAFGLLFSFIAAGYVTKIAKKALDDADTVRDSSSSSSSSSKR